MTRREYPKIDPRLPALNAAWNNPPAYEAEREEGQRKLTALFDDAMARTPQSIAQRARWEIEEISNREPERVSVPVQ